MPPLEPLAPSQPRTSTDFLAARRVLLIESLARRKNKHMEPVLNEVIAVPKQSHPEAFATRAAYLAMKAAWGKYLKDGNSPSARQHLIYNVLRGTFPQKGFTPATNKVKLANGHQDSFKNERSFLISLLTSKNNAGTWQLDTEKILLLPFGPTVTRDVLYKALEALTK